MILERELYKSISTTRAILKSLRAYSFTSLRILIKGKGSILKNDKERGLPQLIDPSSCSGCNDCAVICPTACLDVKIDKEKLSSMILDVKKCIFCGLCKEVCDPQVIELSDYRSLASHGESSWKIDLVEKNEQA
ncbi:hypothetical protein [Halobacteriovorax sp.]|uniref:hypothetical protein n=1 Tax=Halobacteriovorax sp. TaxID=2020862 RepID=UPI003564237A